MLFHLSCIFNCQPAHQCLLQEVVLLHLPPTTWGGVTCYLSPTTWEGSYGIYLQQHGRGHTVSNSKSMGRGSHCTYLLQHGEGISLYLPPTTWEWGFTAPISCIKGKESYCTYLIKKSTNWWSHHQSQARESFQQTLKHIHAWSHSCCL